MGSGQSQAKWSFTQLQPGTYNVAVTWVPESNLSATVNYNVCNGSKTCQTVSVNQQYSPDDYTDQGVTWRRLGTFTITGTLLVVSAANSGSDGQICADAVRVSPVSSPVLPGIVHVTSANFQQQVMQSQVPVLVDFYADWCEWCQKQDPALEDIADNYSNVKIAKINIDESPALAQQYNIDAIPHLFVFRNGQEVTDALGLQTEAQLLAMLGIATPAQATTSVSSLDSAFAAMATPTQTTTPKAPSPLVANPSATIATSPAAATTSGTPPQSPATTRPTAVPWMRLLGRSRLTNRA